MPSNLFDSFINTVDKTANTLSGQSTQVISGSNFQADGFVVSGSPSSDGSQLPSYNVKSLRPNAKEVRRIVHWFVPEYGVVKMYVNPQGITYTLKKIIQKQMTKGGYSVQYWGEDLTTLSISGTTGSSGVEGLNVLNEIYRAEQLAFDGIGLSLSASASAMNSSVVSDTLSSAFGDIAGSLLGSALTSNPGLSDILPQNIPSLASMALGVEMFWNGWVFRGYFESFNFTESADNLGMFTYTINFVVTQRRGYRVNSMPWQHSAIDGPSHTGSGGVPNTFSGGKYGYVDNQSPLNSGGINDAFNQATFKTNSSASGNNSVAIGEVYTPGSRQQQGNK